MVSSQGPQGIVPSEVSAPTSTCMKVPGPAWLGIEEYALETKLGGRKIPVGVMGLAARVPGEDRVQEDQEGRGCNR